MSLAEEKFLAFVADLKTQVEEEVVLERAKAIFSEAVAIIDERQRKAAFERRQEASRGAERLHNMMQKAVQEVEARNATKTPTLTGTFTSASPNHTIDMLAAGQPSIGDPEIAAPHRPGKRSYQHHKYKWYCKKDGPLDLTVPQARAHSRQGKEHLLEPVKQEKKMK